MKVEPDSNSNSDSTPASRSTLREVEWRRAVPGFILGFLTWFVADQFLGGIMPIRDLFMLPLCGTAYALVAITRARRLIWWSTALAILVYFVIGSTPLVDDSIRSWVRIDPPRKADAAVVLSSDVRVDGKPFRVGQVRLLAGYEAVGSGLAPVLVLTQLPRPKASLLPYAKRQLRELQLDIEVIETPMPVRNTRDEAKALAAMAKERGWKRLIVVSDSMHLRRAGALFEREGLEVICRPSLDQDFVLDNLQSGVPRLTAFRLWTHEWVGWQVYRRRGWL